MSQYRFVPLEYVVAAHLTELFAGMEILEHHAFRVTHTRDLEVGEDVTENLSTRSRYGPQTHRYTDCRPAQ